MTDIFFLIAGAVALTAIIIFFVRWLYRIPERADNLRITAELIARLCEQQGIPKSEIEDIKTRVLLDSDRW